MTGTCKKTEETHGKTACTASTMITRRENNPFRHEREALHLQSCSYQRIAAQDEISQPPACLTICFATLRFPNAAVESQISPLRAKSPAYRSPVSPPSYPSFLQPSQLANGSHSKRKKLAHHNPDPTSYQPSPQTPQHKILVQLAKAIPNTHFSTFQHKPL